MSDFPGDFPEEQREEAPDEGELTDVAPDAVANVEKILADLYVYISDARATSMSTALRIDRDYVLRMIQSARSMLPVALRSARWLIKERDVYLARARRDADAVVEQASVEAARMVDRTQVVMQARRSAQEIVDEAEDRERMRRHEVDDYCDRQLARFQNSLMKAMETVAEARRRLQGETEPETQEQSQQEPPRREGFFDQDQV